MLLGVSRCPGRLWLLQGGCRGGSGTSDPARAEMWQRGAVELLPWGCATAALPGMEPSGGFWVLTWCQPCSQVLGHQEGTQPGAQSCVQPSWAGLGCPLLAMATLTSSMGSTQSRGMEREEPVPPSVPALEPCSVPCVCKVRGWGCPGAQGTATPELCHQRGRRVLRYW